ncbi:MAG: hypothetical protein J5850_00805, partial [Clostridia bacterium]|nr:hypothetical protein [Clostridia bacterium]
QDEVTVTAEVDYYIPFTRLFGVGDSKITVKATSRALCADVVGQDTYYRTINSFINGALSTNVAKIVRSGIKIVKNIATAGGDLGKAIVNSRIPEVEE